VVGVGDGLSLAVAVGDDVAVSEGVNVAVIVAVANTTVLVDVGSGVRALVDTIKIDKPPTPMKVSTIRPMMSVFFKLKFPGCK
jgi:hypothetical protein